MRVKRTKEQTKTIRKLRREYDDITGTVNKDYIPGYSRHPGHVLVIRSEGLETCINGGDPVATIDESELAGELAHCVECSWEDIMAIFMGEK